MSNLSNMMISGSYKGLINLEDSTQNLASQSGDVELQDGLGDNIGLRINAQTKEFTIVNNLKVDGNADFNGDVDISGSLTHTGSIDIVGDLTIQGDITANVGNFDTVNARLLNITEESASVIFSSGSNVLGDEETDRQDLIGQVIVSGTLGVEGNSAFTGSLTVSNEISSSTISGIGNVTSYSASVDIRLDQLESDSGSQASQLNNLENFTASQEIINDGYNAFTSSITLTVNDLSSSVSGGQYIQDERLDSLETFTGSLVTSFVERPEFNTFTSSTDIRLNNLELETSSIDNRLTNIESTTSSLETEIDSLSSFTGSYATTGSNTFDGAQIITGSVNGNIVSQSITDNTASFDCALGNFFTLTLPATQTLLRPTNIQPGQTLSIKITNETASSNIILDNSFKFSNQIPYVPSSITGSVDVMTFVSYDATELLGASTYNIG